MEMNVINDIQSIAKAWQPFHLISQIGHIQDEAHYDRMVELADRLIEEGAGNESHPLHDLWLLLTDLIHPYDQQRYPLPDLSGPDMLRFFMAQHNLTPSDLPEVGDQQRVSEILQRKCELNMDQIKALAARFGVTPAVFL